MQWYVWLGKHFVAQKRERGFWMTTQLAIFAVGFYALEEMRNPSSKFGNAFKEEAGEKVLTSFQLALKLTQVESIVK